jgi:hypothetical protein
MASKNHGTNQSRAGEQKPLERGRCPVCGRRRINRPTLRIESSWEAGDLEQMVETMEIGEIASLLGISRWELEKRCQSLGIHIRGLDEEQA